MLKIYRKLVAIRNENFYSTGRIQRAIKRIVEETGETEEAVNAWIIFYDNLLSKIRVSGYDTANFRKTFEEDSLECSVDLIFEEKPTALSVQLLADDLYPPTSCSHEYDCCGQWYRSGWPNIERITPTHYRIFYACTQNV